MEFKTVKVIWQLAGAGFKAVGQLRET